MLHISQSTPAEVEYAKCQILKDDIREKQSLISITLSADEQEKRVVINLTQSVDLSPTRQKPGHSKQEPTQSQKWKQN